MAATAAKQTLSRKGGGHEALGNFPLRFNWRHRDHFRRKFKYTAYLFPIYCLYIVFHRE